MLVLEDRTSSLWDDFTSRLNDVIPNCRLDTESHFKIRMDSQCANDGTAAKRDK